MPIDSDQRRIFEKLDTINERVADTNVKLAQFVGGAKEWRDQCKQVHKIVLGNGSIGIRAKICVIWGLLFVVYTGIIGAAATWFFEMWGR